MARRLIILAGWLAAAVLAVLVGLLAITLIGGGLTSPIARPLSHSEVDRELAARPDQAPPATSPTPSASVSPSASTSAGSGPVSTRTRGGTVIARCVAGQPRVVSMTPAQGYEVHERGDDEGEFRGVSDNHDRVKLDLSCGADGRPVVAVTEERDDD